MGTRPAAARSAAPGPTERLAGLVAGMSHARLQPAEKEAVGRHLLDTIGACLMGARQPVTRIVADLLAEMTGGVGVPVAGLPRRFDALSAAYIMGTAAHGLELDDGYTPGSVHPGTTVVPALLAAGALADVDGERLAAAVAAGYEVAGRLAEAIHPQSRQRGFHNTSLVGPLAAAAAVGVLRGHDRGMVERSLGIAASSAAGLFAFLAGGGEVKRTHPGHAAREGLQAVLLAERGLTGPHGVLEGKDGFFQAFSSGAAAADRFHLPAAGEPLVVAGCYLKPHACCRHLHAALDGIIDIVRTETLSAADIERIEIGTYAISAAHAETGWSEPAEAQMSFGYCAARAVLDRRLDLALFEPSAITDPRIAKIAARVAVATDEECQRLYPRHRPSKVVVRTRSGTFDRFVRDPYGEPAVPMTPAHVMEKFLGLAEPVLGAGRAREIAGLVLDPGRLDSTRRLSGLLATAE